MLIIGCDFHPTFQQITLTDTETGEYGERRLHHPQEAEQFYRALAGRQVRVGMEATGSFRWFRRLLSELGHELWLGNPTQIRASAPRRQKTDKRDARQLLKLLLEERFPQVWLPAVADEDLRQLLLHRCRLVRQRTKLRNQLDAIAKNEGLVGLRVGTQKGRRQLEALPLSGWYQRRRQDLFELLDQLEQRIGPLNQAVQQAAEERADAQRLMTHPGVGPVVALAYVLVIGDWRRFPRGKYLASYLGLIPEEDSSSHQRRLGHITKQGNSLVRWLLVQAALKAQQYDPTWHRQYLRLARNKHHGVAKVAIARKLAIRLYWMLRSGQDYEQVHERSSHAGQSVSPSGTRSSETDLLIGRPVSFT